MGFSRHIGRIGALAVALGVGTGVGACPGIAWADESTDSTSSVAGPSSRSDDAPTPGPATNTKDSDDAGDTHASEDGTSHATTDTDDAESAEPDPDTQGERECADPADVLRRRPHSATPRQLPTRSISGHPRDLSNEKEWRSANLFLVSANSDASSVR